MKIELKNVKISKEFSEETIMFRADVYVDGRCCAYANNDGRGGCTFYRAYPNCEDLLVQAEMYCLKLPKIKYGSLELDMNLEMYIDELVSAIFNEKEIGVMKKKIKKLSENHLVYGASDYSSFSYISFKGKPKFSEIKKTVQGRMALDNLVKRIKSELKENEIIFNDNLVD